MGGPETRIGGVKALFPDEVEPSLERDVVDTGVVFAIRDRGSFEDGDAVGDGKDLGCAGHVVDLGEGEHALEDVSLVERAGRVGDAATAVDGVGVQAAGVAVAGEGDVAGHVLELGAAELKVEAAEPRLEG